MIKINLKVVLLSASQYYDGTSLIETFKGNDTVKWFDVERYAIPSLDKINTVFINPNFRESFKETQEIIEKIRKDQPNIVIVLCGEKQTTDDFINSTKERFKHYFRFNIVAKQKINITDFNKIIETCQTELYKNYYSKYNFDIALSYAGEDGEYVSEFANHLKKLDVSLFYDKFEMSDILGNNLFTYLSDIYSKKARYTIMFISEHYRSKRWTNHEREVAQTRAFKENGVYIIPARFDNTEIPGLLDNIAYIDLNKYKPLEFANIILEKLKNL